MCGNMRRDKVINKDILIKIGAIPIEEKMRKKSPTMVWSCAT